MTSDLDPRQARGRLGRLGQAIYDVDARTFWERDTALLPKRLQLYRRRCRQFAQARLAPHALEADRAPGEFDVRALFADAAREGFQTEWLPPPFGTGDFRSMARLDLLPSAIKAEEFCAACGGLGLSLLAHDLGTAPLVLSGDWTAALRWQRRIYAEIRAGEPSIAAFAITEPGAGSDVEETRGAATARIATRARRAAGGWRLSGSKCFISDGAVARWFTLFAALEGRGVESWTCFLLDASMPGLSVGRREHKLGQRAADASEILLDDVFVPDERVIGALEAGWAINRNVLNFSRPVVGAIALGIARGAFEHAVATCNATSLGGRLLIDYQDVQLRLADMLTKLQAARALIWHTARYSVPFQAAGAMTKLFCSDTAWEVCSSAMELLGEHGSLHARSVEKAARDARLTQIYEGTNQINRLAIIEGQAGAEFAVGEENAEVQRRRGAERAPA